MKKILSVVVSFLLICSLSLTVFADSAALIYVDKVYLSAGDPILIPVCIKDNPGLMGFRITVEYSADEIEVLSVSKGAITQKGNFNSNEGLKNGYFDVVWNNTSEIADDGTLFTISAKVLSDKTEMSEIKLSYSQEDTFNEKWDDVVLDCGSIMLTKDNSSTFQNNNSETDADTVADSEQIVDAVNNALESFGYNSFSDIEDEGAFVSEVNKNISVFMGDNSARINGIADLNNKYVKSVKSIFINDLNNYLSEKEKNDVLNNALKSVGATSLKDVSSENREAFISGLSEGVKRINPDSIDITKNIPVDQSMDIINEAFNQGLEEKSIDKLISNKSFVYFVIPIAVVIVLIILCTFIFKVKRKKASNNS